MRKKSLDLYQKIADEEGVTRQFVKHLAGTVLYSPRRHMVLEEHEELLRNSVRMAKKMTGAGTL